MTLAVVIFNDLLTYLFRWLLCINVAFPNAKTVLVWMNVEFFLLYCLKSCEGPDYRRTLTTQKL